MTTTEVVEQGLLEEVKQKYVKQGIEKGKEQGFEIVLKILSLLKEEFSVKQISEMLEQPLELVQNVFDTFKEKE